MKPIKTEQAEGKLIQTISEMANCSKKSDVPFQKTVDNVDVR